MDGQTWTAHFEAPNGEPVLHAYPDPLTGAEPFTIGLGSTGPDIHKDTVWTLDQCLHRFYNDYAVAQAGAAKVIGMPTWAQLSVPRQCVLADAVYNIGVQRLEGFHQMLDAIRRHDWQRASDELLDSAYAKQVKGRAIKNASVLFHGVWP